MDSLERLVTSEATEEELSKEHAHALRGAREAWDIVTGLEPAYAKVLDLRYGINKSEYLVEIDGVRIKAFHNTAVGVGKAHFWDVAERGIKRSDLELRALANPRILRRRRKRLEKRGEYNG